MSKIISTTSTEKLRINRESVDVYLVRDTGLPIQNNGLWSFPTSTTYYQQVITPVEGEEEILKQTLNRTDVLTQQIYKCVILIEANMYNKIKRMLFSDLSDIFLLHIL